MNTPHIVALVHHGRCGSTVLGDMLGRNPDVRWDGEVLEPFMAEMPAGARASEWRFPTDVGALIQARAAKGAKQVYVVSLKLYHLRAAGVEMEQAPLWLRGLGVKAIVLLERRNLVRKLVSARVAEERGLWHVQRGAVVPPAAKVVLDLSEIPFERDGTRALSGYIDSHRAQMASLREALMTPESPRFIGLTYESDVEEDPGKGYKRICELAGVPAFYSEPRYEKTTSAGDLADVVANFEELARLLRGTKHEWMLTR